LILEKCTQKIKVKNGLPKGKMENSKDKQPACGETTGKIPDHNGDFLKIPRENKFCSK